MEDLVCFLFEVKLDILSSKTFRKCKDLGVWPNPKSPGEEPKPGSFTEFLTN